jgi:hypothetical protein
MTFCPNVIMQLVAKYDFSRNWLSILCTTVNA